MSSGRFRIGPGGKIIFHSFGLILLRGDNAPHLASRDETIQLSLGELLRQDPGAAIRNLLDLVPEPRFDSGDHQRCWHTRAAKEYPLLYDVITHLIIEHPGLIAAREIHIDEIQVDGAFHPLYIHTGGQITGFTYDWFGIESGDALTYIRLHGRGAVSRTERGTWQSSEMPIGSLDWTAMRTEIATRLHLDNEHPTLAM